MRIHYGRVIATADIIGETLMNRDGPRFAEHLFFSPLLLRRARPPTSLGVHIKILSLSLSLSTTFLLPVPVPQTCIGRRESHHPSAKFSDGMPTTLREIPSAKKKCTRSLGPFNRKYWTDLSPVTTSSTMSQSLITQRNPCGRAQTFLAASLARVRCVRAGNVLSP